MDKNKEVSAVKTPIWANIAASVAGFISGIMALIQGVVYFSSNGGLGFIFVLAGLALVSLGIAGLYLANEGDHLHLTKVALAIGWVFALAQCFSFFGRSGSVPTASAPIMVIVGLLYLLAAAFLFVSMLRFKEEKTTHKTLDFAFAGASIIVVLVAASVFNARGAITGINIAGLLLGTFLCVTSGLTTFYFGKIETAKEKVEEAPKTEEEKAKDLLLYKDLLEKGAISQEEYLYKKNEILL